MSEVATSRVASWSTTCGLLATAVAAWGLAHLLNVVPPGTEASLTVLAAFIAVAAFVALARSILTSGVVAPNAGRWMPDAIAPEAKPPGGRDFRVMALWRDVRHTLQEPSEPDSVHGHLSSITTRLLRDRHGIDMAADPDAARDVLGDDLYSYLTAEPSRRRRSKAQIDRALTRIEEL